MIFSKRANSMILEAHLMSHDAGITAIEPYTHLHMLRRCAVLESTSVDLPQQDLEGGGGGGGGCVKGGWS